MKSKKQPGSRTSHFLADWALFDARQVFMIMLALAGLLLYAYMSSG
jgi:hypothetical protein